MTEPGPGHQPTGDGLDVTTPPRGGSGVPRLAKYRRVILTLQEERDAALARAQAAEARVRLLEGEGGLTLFALMELHDALRAAARSVVNATIKVVPQTHLDRDPIGCWCCDRWIHLPDDTHDDGCPVGHLAAVLDGSGRDA